MELKRGVRNRMDTITKDKASEEYWSNFWLNHPLPDEIKVEVKNNSTFAARQFHEFYLQLFNPTNSDKKLIEIGCGNSVWLSYFAKQFQFNVSGIDYSEFGCEQTRKILSRDKITGNIYYGDLFNPPVELKNQFDVVCSFGVVEHFNNTEDVLKHIGEFLKEDGLLITTIPNLTGITGWLQRWMNKPVFDIHKVMTLKNIQKHIENAGFTIVKSDLLNPISFGVTMDEIDHQKVKFKSIKKLILKCFQVIELIGRKIDDQLFKLPKTELLCAGMIVVAKKSKPINERP